MSTYLDRKTCKHPPCIPSSVRHQQVSAGTIIWSLCSGSIPPPPQQQHRGKDGKNPLAHENQLGPAWPVISCMTTQFATAACKGDAADGCRPSQQVPRLAASRLFRREETNRASDNTSRPQSREEGVGGWLVLLTRRIR